MDKVKQAVRNAHYLEGLDAEYPCEGQYLSNGNCTQTERPSGRILPCNKKECYLDEE